MKSKFKMKHVVCRWFAYKRFDKRINAKHKLNVFEGEGHSTHKYSLIQMKKNLTLERVNFKFSFSNWTLSKNCFTFASHFASIFYLVGDMLRKAQLLIFKLQCIFAINMSMFLTKCMLTFQVCMNDIFYWITEVLRCHYYEVGYNLV